MHHIAFKSPIIRHVGVLLRRQEILTPVQH